MRKVRITQLGHDHVIVTLQQPTAIGELLSEAGLPVAGLRLALDGHRVDASAIVSDEAEITSTPRIEGG